MSGHVYHEGLPGYESGQLLHDGCPECISRSGSLRQYLPHADELRWQWMWRRAVKYGQDGLPGASKTELPILRDLWQLAVAFQQHQPPAALLDFAYEGFWMVFGTGTPDGAERS